MNGGKRMHRLTGTEMGQTDGCHNGRLFKSNGEKCRAVETNAR